ncbi:hypothetical protein P153DRAFT_371556 [Dothidotthia symphoricarpi CBS 119687]|uniref:Uncharacterized protein n=1 Tax=Dothidotthia symphoricarpi CBS 119687 TaxID=1392245 RepID=A0A6A5ZZ37_9PLEO|nr:uncharacterized protein P153DRAFT_371556 [Dothidotthia symphoricarpi CBS 119687]KAF2123581.1 hypothetical protein P153DRAFT_371556 [Dothidotthia symphoricarpi CBS 119687]
MDVHHTTAETDVYNIVGCSWLFCILIISSFYLGNATNKGELSLLAVIWALIMSGIYIIVTAYVEMGIAHTYATCISLAIVFVVIASKADQPHLLYLFLILCVAPFVHGGYRLLMHYGGVYGYRVVEDAGEHTTWVPRQDWTVTTPKYSTRTVMSLTKHEPTISTW